MAKVIVLLFGFVAVICANPVEDTQKTFTFSSEKVQGFKEVLEEATKDGHLTCENYRKLCAGASGDGPDSGCHIMFKGYLCDNLKDTAGIKEIMSRIELIRDSSNTTLATNSTTKAKKSSTLDDDNHKNDY